MRSRKDVIASARSVLQLVYHCTMCAGCSRSPAWRLTFWKQSWTDGSRRGRGWRRCLGRGRWTGVSREGNGAFCYERRAILLVVGIRLVVAPLLQVG
jgi:hypothetical protein